MAESLGKTIQDLKNEATSEINNVGDSKTLESFRIKYLGEKSFLASSQKNIKNVPAPERPDYGKLLNELKEYLHEIYSGKKVYLEGKELEEKISSAAFDITLPGICHES